VIVLSDSDDERELRNGFLFGIAFIVGSMAWHLRPNQRR
jgi:hypothetical protein